MKHQQEKMKDQSLILSMEAVSLEAELDFGESSGSLPEGDGFGPPGEGAKGKKGARKGKKSGKFYWSEAENGRYFKALRQYRKYFVLGARERKEYRVNVKMANIVRTKTSTQCHSHHQKMIKKYLTVDNIIQHFQQQAAQKGPQASRRGRPRKAAAVQTLPILLEVPILPTQSAMEAEPVPEAVAAEAGCSEYLENGEEVSLWPLEGMLSVLELNSPSEAPMLFIRYDDDEDLFSQWE